jgi:NH3-dependent NAD+ synthetase
MAPTPSQAATEAGLDKTIKDVPLKTAVLDLSGGYDSATGGWARGELGAHLAPSVALYAFGQADQHGGVSAGAGARFTFDI